MSPTLFSSEPLEAGKSVTLGPDAVAHLRALRVTQGERLTLSDGKGTVAAAMLHKASNKSALLDVLGTEFVDPLPEVHLLVPVADKDRVLWLAEKSVELGITSWRPVVWRRSRSVESKGQGTGFTRRVLLRMTAALEQSGGAWLPDIFPECNVERAIAAAPSGSRLLLDPAADRYFPATASEPLVLVVGPEGGMEDDEMAAFSEAGFARVRIAANTLRFETAAIAAVTLGRAALTR